MPYLTNEQHLRMGYIGARVPTYLWDGTPILSKQVFQILRPGDSPQLGIVDERLQSCGMWKCAYDMPARTYPFRRAEPPALRTPWSPPNDHLCWHAMEEAMNGAVSSSEHRGSREHLLRLALFDPPNRGLGINKAPASTPRATGRRATCISHYHCVLARSPLEQAIRGLADRSSFDLW